jgi:lysophospholipase L1-like esterase
MQRSGSSIRGALATAALVVVGVCLSVAVAEVALRIVAAFRPEVASAPVIDPALEGLPDLKSLRDLSRPNARGRLGNVLFRTNSSGFRGREFDLEAPPGVFRIAVIGDSYTMGWMVAEESTYAVRLENMLNSGSADRRFEVLNLGLSGLNLRQAILRLQRIGLAFEPDLIVYGFTLNDIFRRRDARAGLADQRDELLGEWGRHADSPSHLVRAVWPRWLALRNALLLPMGSLERTLEDNYSDPSVSARVDLGLDSLAAIARKRGLCVVMLVHTEIARLRFFHSFVTIYDRMEQAARERGIHVVQSYPHYRWNDAASLRVSAIDSHPNAEGHRLLANALFDGLRELPEGCGLGEIGAAPEGNGSP